MRIATTAIAVTFWLLAGNAAAQGTLNLSVTRIDGPGGDRATEVVVNGANGLDCADPAATAITILSSQPKVSTSFDLWVSSSADCAPDGSRSGSNQVCYDIMRNVDLLDANNTFTVTLAELAVGDVDPCATATPSGATFRVYVFDSGEESTTTLGSHPYGFVEIQVDPNAPVAPTVTSGDGAGSTSVPVTWTAPAEGDSARLTFDVYGARAGADCADASATPELLKANVSGSSYGVNPTEAGLATGEGLLVTVRAVDPAGNVGEPSEPVCITMQPTAGFCDVYGSMGSECPNSCAVALPGRAGGAPITALLFFAALVVARARRSRKDPA
jgi:hypothetical protein